MSTLKKIFIISSVILAVSLVFLGIYNFAFKESSPEKNVPAPKEKTAAETEQKSAETGAQKEKIYPLTDEAVIAPALSRDGKGIIYYAASSGNVYEITLQGSGGKTISDTDLPGLADVIWSPDKDKVISIFDKGGATERYLYDYNTGNGVKLKEGMEYIAWTNLGDKIIYKYYDARSNKRSLNIANPDGSNWKEIAGINLRLVEIAPIPKTSLLSFWNAPDGFEATSLQTVGIAGGEIKTIFSGKFGADYLWSPDGEKVLISSAEAKGGSKITLATTNANGGEYQNLGIPTLVSKCVWSKNSKTVFCALPGSIPEGSVMPNDYRNRKFYTRDSFWKVDVTTGKKERVVELADINEGFDATDLFLSPAEDILFFVNRIDGKLYGIGL